MTPVSGLLSSHFVMPPCGPGISLGPQRPWAAEAGRVPATGVYVSAQSHTQRPRKTSQRQENGKLWEGPRPLGDSAGSPYETSSGTRRGRGGVPAGTRGGVLKLTGSHQEKWRVPHRSRGQGQPWPFRESRGFFRSSLLSRTAAGPSLTTPLLRTGL